MRAIIALCSMILLFSISGVQAQTDSVPVAGDSTQAPAPAVEPPIAVENNVAKTAPPLPVRKMKDANSLTGTYLFSCNGLYFYNKSVGTGTDYDWYSGTTIKYDITYKTYMYAVLFNVNYFVAEGFSIGGTLGVLSMSTKRETDYEEDYSYYYYGNSGTSVNLIGPRLAYYHGKKNSKVLPFAAFEYDILTSDFGEENAMRIGAGVLLQPKPHFGISFGLDYLKLG
ncbi:MAG: hypothetical protein Q7W05_00490, partial [Deltaproteobacteria bacterium]|nr:hypothetical protein [Deltaproteobacteria bacterium]